MAKDSDIKNFKKTFQY